MRLSFALLLAGCGRIDFDRAIDAMAAASLCDRIATPLYCNDFEGGNLAGATSFGSGTRTATGFEGDGYVLNGLIGGGDIVRFELPNPITSGALHLGGRLFADPGPIVDDYLVLVEAKGTSDKISMDGSAQNSMQIVSTIGTNMTDRTAPMAFPRGRWVCFELIIEVAPMGDVAALLDGVEIARITGTATQPAEGILRCSIGAIGSPSNSATERITYDNWIISRSPIGCP